MTQKRTMPHALVRDAGFRKYGKGDEVVFITVEDRPVRYPLEFYVKHDDPRIAGIGQQIMEKLLHACNMKGIEDTDELKGKWILWKWWDELMALAMEQVPLGLRPDPTPAEAQRPHSKDEGRFVYVISCVNSTPELCKIGIAGSPEKRLKQLATSSPHALRLEMARQTAKAIRIERMAHGKFAAYRRNGEWFEMPAITAIDYVNQAITETMQ